jgi:N6-adenosine-specific RNA methylase IME4
MMPRSLHPAQVGLPYPTLSLEEIRAFPIGDYAADDAHLYLWTTDRFLPGAFAIVESWGFTKIATMI